MRIAYVVMFFCAGLTVLPGCEPKPAETGRVMERPSDADAMARVDAALEISNLNERDDALGAVCRDAARIGAVDAVKKALANISNLNAQDQVASDSAIALRDRGQVAAATEVAKSINNLSQRDKALKELATQ